jgi:hypothetical protein
MPFHIPVTFALIILAMLKFHENRLRAEHVEVYECQGKGFTDPRVIGFEKMEP